MATKNQGKVNGKTHSHEVQNRVPAGAIPARDVLGLTGTT